jgi:tetratricopeptide (TPR) repeat protein
LHDNLPENAVIATHDIGAIAFYSGRRIADMVGLVSPEMINNIGSFNKLMQFLAQKKVTHLALLRNWFTVENQDPLFQTDIQHPEIMEVFEFNPARIHFTPQDAARMTETAEYYLSLGNIQQAGPILQQSVKLDPQSSKTHYFLGNAYMSIGSLDKAEAELQTALRLYPTYWDAQLMLAQVAAKRNRPNEVVAQLETIIRKNPKYAQGYRALVQAYQAYHLDSIKASYYLQRYNELAKIPAP